MRRVPTQVTIKIKDTCWHEAQDWLLENMPNRYFDVYRGDTIALHEYFSGGMTMTYCPLATFDNWEKAEGFYGAMERLIIRLNTDPALPM